MNYLKSIRRQQAGMASIMITMLMMVVISLIVLGFAQISRHEQQQAIDRALSAQAFFAAESAINDVRQTVQTKLARGEAVPEKTECATSTDDQNYPFNPVIDGTNKVSYSCLLVTTKLDALRSGVASNTDSVKLPIETDGAAITKLRIGWKKNNVTAATLNQCRTSVPANDRFDPAGASSTWTCPFGVLRFELVSTATMSDAALAASQRVMFLYPTRASGTATRAMTNGAVAQMNCTVADGCGIDITGLSGTKFAVKLSSIYNDGDIVIKAYDASNNQLQLQNAQVLVDVTGKAEDVLRRVQVRLPLVAGPSTPDYALQSASSVCKRFEYDATSFTIPSTVNNQDQHNPMCKSLYVPPPPPENCPVQNDLMIVMDTSESMDNDTVAPGVTRFDKAKQIINRLIDNSQFGRTNYEGVLGFSGRGNDITFVKDITGVDPGTSTTGRTGLKNTITNATPVYGTAFIPMLNRSYSELSQGQSRATAQKYIIIFSDGENNDEADAPILAVANNIKNNGVKIYTVSIGTPRNTTNGFYILRNIASVINGNRKYYDGRNAAALDAITDDIISEVTCQTPIQNP